MSGDHFYYRTCKHCQEIFDTPCKYGKVCDDCKEKNKLKKPNVNVVPYYERYGIAKKGGKKWVKPREEYEI